LDESKRNFELQRDKEFTMHVCADHSRAKSQSTKHDVKQDWEKVYRAAIIESDRSKLLHRIEDAEAAILERSRSLSKSPANTGERAGSYHSGPVHFELAAGKSRRLTRSLGKRSAPTILKSWMTTGSSGNQKENLSARRRLTLPSGHGWATN
jgi:hypothetical protein